MTSWPAVGVAVPKIEWRNGRKLRDAARARATQMAPKRSRLLVKLMLLSDTRSVRAAKAVPT